MNIPEMRSIIKENRDPYEELIKRRGYLFPDDEGVRYQMLMWFDQILTAKKEEVVGNHIDWIKDKGIKLYK